MPNSNSPDCPACIAQRCHTKEEDATYHPLAGHGVQDSRQNPIWSKPGLKELVDSELMEVKLGASNVAWDGFDGLLGLHCTEHWTPVAWRSGMAVAWLCSQHDCVHQVIPRKVEPPAPQPPATPTPPTPKLLGPATSKGVWIALRAALDRLQRRWSDPRKKG